MERPRFIAQGQGAAFRSTSGYISLIDINSESKLLNKKIHRIHSEKSEEEIPEEFTITFCWNFSVFRGKKL